MPRQCLRGFSYNLWGTVPFAKIRADLAKEFIVMSCDLDAVHRQVAREEKEWQKRVKEDPAEDGGPKVFAEFLDTYTSHLL